MIYYNQAACRPNRPMGNPHRGPGRASQLEAGVSYPAKRARTTNRDLSKPEPRKESGKGNKMHGIQNQMEEFLQAVTKKTSRIIEEYPVQPRPGTYCVSQDRSLVPWYKLTSVQNIQASLRDFISTIEANSVMMDKQELDELLHMTSLLQTQRPAEPRQLRHQSTDHIQPLLPPIRRGIKCSSKERESEDGENRARGQDKRKSFVGSQYSRRGSLRSPVRAPLRSPLRSSGSSGSFTYCSMPTVVF